MKPLQKRAKIALCILIFAVLWSAEGQTTPPAQTQTTNNSSTQSQSQGDGFIYIFFKIFLSEVFDKVFITAVLLGFIYGPSFAVAAYEVGVLLSCLLAATIGEVFDVFPAFLFNVLNAFMYFLFGFHSFLYVYDEKNKEKYEDIPEDFKPTTAEVENDKNRESAKTKTEKGDEEEHVNMVDKVQNDLMKKAANQMVDETKGQIIGVIRDFGEEKPDKPKEEKGFMKTVFSFSFMKTKKIRFFGACLLYLVASLNSGAFKNIWQLRENNSLGKILLICLLIFLLCGLLLAILAYIVKKKIYKNYVKSSDNIKMVKSFACAALIFISFIQLFS